MINLIAKGRRYYIGGNTYAVRDHIRAMGAHWDASAKMWWTAKRDEAEQLVAKLSSAAASTNGGNGGSKTPRDGMDSVVAGRGEYKGKAYYLAGRADYDRESVDIVRTRDHAKVLLYFRDGSSQFWAAAKEVTITKTYDRPQTLRGLHEFAAQKQRETEQAAQAARRTPEQIEADRAAEIERIRAVAAKAGVVLIEPVTTISYTGQGRRVVGQIVAHQRDGHLLVVSVGEPYYVSARDAENDEDMGHYGTRTGWTTPYDMVRIAEPAALRAEREQAEATKAAEADAYRAALAPAAGYRTRHGATHGGTITIDGEQMVEQGIRGATHEWIWERIAQRVTARGTTGSIAGRIMDQDTLYRAILPDGRPVFREDHYRGFGDDLRSTFHLPADIYEIVIRAEVVSAGITREQAEEWLAQYRGCVGTELYEAALTLSAPAITT